MSPAVVVAGEMRLPRAMTHDEHDARTSAPSDATSPEPLSDGSNDAEVRAIAERLVRERRVGAPANPGDHR